MCKFVVPYMSFCNHRCVERCILSFARRKCCDSEDRVTVVAPLVGWCVACAGRIALWDEEEGTSDEETEYDYFNPHSHPSDIFLSEPETREAGVMRNDNDYSLLSARREGDTESSRGRSSTSSSGSSTGSEGSWISDSNV